VAKPDHVELDAGKFTFRLPILFEDRSVLAIDKPAGWMLVPFTWQRTNRNLQAAISSSIGEGAFWAQSRNLKFLRHIHRLDAETTGILLFAKSMGGVTTYGDLFESRKVQKRYLVVVHGTPRQDQWISRQKIGSDPRQIARMKVDESDGKEAETEFRVLARQDGIALLEAFPLTGRTHQIRVHAMASGYPVAGDPLYGARVERFEQADRGEAREFPMGLRAVELHYTDPFTRRAVRIQAPTEKFLTAFGFDRRAARPAPAKAPALAPASSTGPTAASPVPAAHPRPRIVPPPARRPPPPRKGTRQN
jgi:23S rRNA pseudouridine1911/1915/1917 synthase